MTTQASAAAVKHLVILGGGSAGWITAGVLASDHNSHQADGLKVTVIESPNVAPLGVGEGTWPSMRLTLKRMGVSETDFFRECDASFKQGIKFVGWVDNTEDDYYYHPLELPRGFNQLDLVSPWLKIKDQVSFVGATCVQGHLCERGLAPKQLETPEYASVANYAYHFSAAKLSQFLTRHCTQKLGVTHVVDEVTQVESAENGDIQALITSGGQRIEADLFVDCSGASAKLIGQHFGVGYCSQKHVIFNDRALAAQIPYASEDSPIASHTVATARSNGWIWDIGLPSRRGVGYVFASDYIGSDKVSVELKDYIALSLGRERAEQVEFRELRYEPGFREKFWHKNCVAVGMSAGFVEPLEATALVMIEASARMISAELPASREVMGIVEKRFNERFAYYWRTTIDFLKLQYVLTQRTDTAYWRDCADEASVPDTLKEYLQLWSRQVPNQHDFPLAEEMLPAASWQYILYGMRFVTQARATSRRSSSDQAFAQIRTEVQQLAERYAQHLPKNRDLIRNICKTGLRRE
ncbi:tryptophan halogenase family protein [Gilvimarinus algae]|uniref:Tryptophan 7-halogenase n=1 Tax=Gilvimarinus algae TaxID=3058037 RepID=A0ABT8TD47_9GAMM|nr:tryptophan halogenase family protein [Gilvimarinus sp. SDUM040014]MDO3382034.1 tryptophan 7-halogenase [Gilvimarinus sp. SDUM040014]